jgi:hemoglobin/transferrin/lactoferrin receptor protein
MNNAQLRRSAGGWSPSAGATIEPVKDLQFYVNYSDAVRMPTLFESVKAYTILINPDLRPERSRNWEVGANLVRKGVFAADDKAMLKLDYFNWNVKDFVARQYTTFDDDYLNLTISGLQIYNIDRARFAGIEFSGQYDIGGFSAQLAANYYTNVEFCQTADTCANKTLSADYATNQVPPKYSVNLTLAQKLFADKLTIGGRASFIGKRAAGHGQPVAGLLTLISVVNWKPYAVADLFADYKLTPKLTLWTRVENVLDKYYVDPLSLVDYPAPGRTFRFGLTGNFGGPRSSSPNGGSGTVFDDSPVDWTGFHLGAFSGYDFGRFRGRMIAFDGSTTGYPAREAPHQTLSGFSFGGGAGYDSELADRFIVGIEADIARLQIGGTQVTYADEGAACYNCAAGDSNLLRRRAYESELNSKVKWLSTLRGRLGYEANNRLMVYATGGLGFLRQDEARTQYALSKPNDTTSQRLFTERRSATRTGFVLGGGAEYALDRHWSLKGEALFSWFGGKRMSFPDARAGVLQDTTTGGVFDMTLPGCDPASNFQACFTPIVPVPGSANQAIGRRITSKLTVPMIRIGINYHF